MSASREIVGSNVEKAIREADLSTYEVIESHDPIMVRPVGVEQKTPDGRTVDHALLVGRLRTVCVTHGIGCPLVEVKLIGSGFITENRP